MKNAYSMPVFSQHLHIKSKKWRKKSCGIICLAMILKNLGNYIPPEKLLKLGLKFNFTYKNKRYSAYSPKIGWNQWGLAHIAEKFNFKGIVYDWSINNDHCKKLNKKEAFKKLVKLLKKQPLIASIKRPRNQDASHLIVLTKMQDNKILYNDPDSKTKKGIYKTISAEKFIRSWTKRVIAIHV